MRTHLKEDYFISTNDLAELIEQRFDMLNVRDELIHDLGPSLPKD